MKSPDAYDFSFYSEIHESSARSAEVVVPLIMELLSPASVIDVGCGIGSWTSAFTESGVATVLGVDAEYVDLNDLVIDRDCFKCIDLSKQFELPTGFDLAVCLEVAEHLPRKLGKVLVRQLTCAAPVVVFSAAVPGQGGTNHMNEQWHEYWHRLFEAQGYLHFDAVRPRILANESVSWWYRQNLFIYVRSSHPSVESLQRQCISSPIVPISTQVLDQCKTFRGLTKAVAFSAWRAVLNRLG